MTPDALGWRGRRVIRSIVPVICPARYVTSTSTDAIVDHVVGSLAAAPRWIRSGLAAGLVAYDLAALPRYRTRAHHLVGADAETYFASWEHGPTPLHVNLARALNQLTSLACYEQPDVMADVGYAPQRWIDEVSRRRLAVFRDDVRAHQHQILAPDPLRPGIRVRSRTQRRERA